MCFNKNTKHKLCDVYGGDQPTRYYKFVLVEAKERGKWNMSLLQVSLHKENLFYIKRLKSTVVILWCSVSQQ